MYTAPSRYLPFLFRPLAYETIEIPRDLQNLLEISKKVQRYNYGILEINKIFCDTTESHTKRIALHIKNLPSSGFLDHDKLLRMAWIHDLPEGVAQADVGSDVLGYLSNTAQDTKEMETAKSILSSDDFHLYELIEYNKIFLKKAEMKDWDIDQEAVVFKTTDWVTEGLISMVWWVAEWLKSDDYNRENALPPIESWQHVTRRSQQIYKRIESLSDTYADLRNYLLPIIRTEFFETALMLWGQVPADRISPVVQVHIDETQSFYKTLIS